MKFYNTKTRKIEDFIPLNSKEVKIYYCGPTVYNYAHIWNLRTYVFEDVVVRTLRFLWYNVKTLMNITDIDDKTIRDSQKSWEKLLDFTKKYSDFFLNDLKKLNVILADNIVPISELIPEMIRMIQTMINRKNAYLSDDWSIYFDVKSYKKYWKFANLDMSWMKKWARIDNDEYDKESASDFVLWKSWKESDGENFLEAEFIINEKISPSLKGKKVEWDIRKVLLKWRPWWHIECSACNIKYFWPQIDIHMWWVDLIFPHHQNEIAQSEACTRKEFSKYWLHTWHLMVDWKKMAKSANNFYKIIDLEKKYLNINPSLLYRAIRLSFINSKYNNEVNFTFKKVESNIIVIKSIDETFRNINREIKVSKNNMKVSKKFSDQMQYYLKEFISHLENDFNLPESIAVFHDFIKYINIWNRKKAFSIWELKSILDMLKTFNQVLAIIDFDIVNEKEISNNIYKKLEQRNQAKINKDYKEADFIREELQNLWYKIIDNIDWSYLEKI